MNATQVNTMKQPLTRFSPGFLKQLRVSANVKQTHLAEIMRVSQSTVSKWETGATAPTKGQYFAILSFLSGPVSSVRDSWLTRLVASSKDPIHLICDQSHTLFAASETRVDEWKRSMAEVSRVPLCIDLPEDILSAEKQYQRNFKGLTASVSFVVRTEGRSEGLYAIKPALMLWERLQLTDGRVVRLVSNTSIRNTTQLIDDQLC